MVSGLVGQVRRDHRRGGRCRPVGLGRELGVQRLGALGPDRRGRHAEGADQRPVEDARDVQPHGVQGHEGEERHERRAEGGREDLLPGGPAPDPGLTRAQVSSPLARLQVTLDQGLLGGQRGVLLGLGRSLPEGDRCPADAEVDHGALRAGADLGPGHRRGRCDRLEGLDRVVAHLLEADRAHGLVLAQQAQAQAPVDGGRDDLPRPQVPGQAGSRRGYRGVGGMDRAGRIVAA